MSANPTIQRCRKFGRLVTIAVAPNKMEAVMNQHAAVKTFSHVKPGDTDYTGGGLRDFFLYRDLGIAKATGGQVICHLVKANPDCPPVDGTGWHRRDCEMPIWFTIK